MELGIIWGIILTLIPTIELRGGLPVALYSIRNESIFLILLIFLIILLINILIIFIVFWFLDYLHSWFMKIKFYRILFEKNLKRIQKRVDKIENKTGLALFVALALIVAIPLPGTGAYTGTLVAWLLELERKKSIASISIGVLIAGIIILIATLGAFNLFF